jgi:hypothetical protein
MKIVILFAFAIAFLTGCASDRRVNTDTEYVGGRIVRGPAPGEKRMNFDNVSYWDGETASGSPSIRINLGEQKAFSYRGNQLVGVSLISTGREGFDTPHGRFAIQQKNRHHVSSVYGDYVDKATGEPVVKDIDRRKDPAPPGSRYDGARMPFFMRFNGGVGMHEGFLPGYAASHGCIRMPGFMASHFFNNVSVGTPVVVE